MYRFLFARRHALTSPSTRSNPPPECAKSLRNTSNQVFQKHLPGEDFSNPLPPFCEPEGPPVAESERAAVLDPGATGGVGGEGSGDVPEEGGGAGEAIAATSFCSSSSEVLQ